MHRTRGEKKHKVVSDYKKNIALDCQKRELLAFFSIIINTLHISSIESKLLLHKYMCVRAGIELRDMRGYIREVNEE